MKRCSTSTDGGRGSRRIGAEVLAQGISVGRFQIRSLMRRLALKAIAPRRFRLSTTDSRHSVMPSPNLLLDGKNKAHKPGAVIVGDITYLPMKSGKWSYLARVARQVYAAHRRMGGG